MPERRPLPPDAALRVARTRLAWIVEHGTLPDGASLADCIESLARAAVRDELARVPRA